MTDTTGIPAYLRFPFAQAATDDYTTGARAFGSGRSNGRKHAGCDLYSPIGTEVFAMAAGTIIQPVYAFYAGTYALEVDHGTFVARYGEIKKDVADKFETGESVAQGQLLGYVGDLINIRASMLHLEIYTGAATGALTDRSNKPYQRRSDLTDPTPYVDRAMLSITQKSKRGGGGGSSKVM